MKNIIIVLVSGLILSGCSGGYPKLGSGYKIDGEGGYTTEIVDSLNNIVIPAYILEYVEDSNFVLVAQSPPNRLPKMKFIVYSDNDRKKIAANKSVFRQYWIINKKQKQIFSYDSINRRGTYSNVYGPYDMNGYLRQRKILDVPRQLKFQCK